MRIGTQAMHEELERLGCQLIIISSATVFAAIFT